MIIDNIRNRAMYYALGNDIRAALDYFASVSENDVKNTDIQIPDTDVVIKVRPLMTRPLEECSFEAHKKHIDIHYVVSGTERIGYSDINKLIETGYDEKGDMVTLDGSGDLLTLEKGCFMIAFPDDAHMPCVCTESPAQLGKMIAKINA